MESYIGLKKFSFHLLQPSNLPRSTVQGAVETAIAAGYRHIDTAYSFQNEADIGKALKSKMNQGVIKRQDMFIVSKVRATDGWYVVFIYSTFVAMRKLPGCTY